MAKKIKNPPLSANLFKAAQSQGSYTLAASIADLIDNSISALATEIHIDIPIHIALRELVITISDNGCGMSGDELVQAMRPASKNPNSVRDKKDLGRFGWGLKSASLAQAERFEVITQNNNSRSFAAWDLEDCQNFEMEFEENTEIMPARDYDQDASWTEVRWMRCARFTEMYVLNQRELSDKVSAAVQDLELIFHRYLEGESGLDPITITINGRNLLPHDPFLRMKSTMLTDPTPVAFRGGTFSYQAFALPTLNSMTEDEHARLSGDEGLVKRQGFYVYRNKRLIISGTWFNIEAYRPLNQLIRIKLDIPNSMDEIWRITVDKADAQLPQDLKRYLKDIVKSLRPHSSKKLTPRLFKRQGNNENFWKLTRKGGVQTLEINQNVEIFNKEIFSREEVLAIANLLQASLPIDLISRENSENFAQINPERYGAKSIYTDTLELLASMPIKWTEEAFIREALRYKLMLGDEEFLTSLAREKYKELGK